MKKSLLAITFGLLSFGAFATKHMVTVQNFSFSPASFNANVGDTVVWTLAGGTHTTTSTTNIPAGAASWDSGILTSTPFEYKITAVGVHNYICTVHGSSMSGSFTAAAASGIKNNTPTFNTSAYPNPFSSKLTVTYAKADQIKVFNMVGAVLFTSETPAVGNKIEMDLTPLASGVYFYSLYKEGVVTETKKVVKK